MNNKTRRRAYAFIFCRGGSKGLPRKNIAKLNNLPLIAYSINVAKQSPSIDRIIVSTDDKEIADVAISFGAEVPFIRPAEIAGDNSNEWFAWQHALNYLKGKGETPDLFVSLPATSPLRSVEDVENCISLFNAGGADIVNTATPARSNPWYSMIKIDENGYSQRVKESKYTRRQDAPEVYDLTGVAYVTTPDFIMSAEGLFDGKLRTHIVPFERAVDIDDSYDFLIAEALLKAQH